MFILHRKTYLIPLVILLLTIAVGLVQAAGNDNLVDAILAIPLPFTTTAQTVGATLETNEVVCGVDNSGTPGVDFISSVWYEYTPTQAGQLNVKATPATGVNASVGVYTGTGHPLSEVECKDDEIALAELVTVPISANTTYFIRIASETGNGDITVEISTGNTIYLALIYNSFVPPVKTWSSQTSGITTGLNGVSCPTNSTCFAVGDGGVIRATTNGGTIWTPQTSNTTQNLFDISCPTATNCFAVGDAGVIKVTTNGGTTWNNQTSGASPNILTGISCFGNTCMAVSGINNGVAVLTTNSGTSWTVLPKLANSNFPGVSCPSSNTCVVVGQAGRIFVFISQGIAALPQVGLNNDLQGVHCPSTSACFSVALNGTIWATANGLNNWGGQTSGTSQSLFGVSCSSAATCFAVGNNGTIRATTNGGGSWKGETTNTTAHLFDISCPGDCFAVGSGGQILIGQ